MKISVEKTGGKKVYVCPEYGEGVYLYPGEIKKQGIGEKDCLTEQEMEQLRAEYAIPRAKKRAMALLIKKDYTEKELREKLSQSLHDRLSAEEALRYVLSHGYVDDMQYAKDYISSKKGRKSFRQIKRELSGKGISSQVMEIAFEEAGEQGTEEIRPLVEKYLRRFSEWNQDAMEKTCAHFYRKGYALRVVRQAVREIQEEDTFSE